MESLSVSKDLQTQIITEFSKKYEIEENLQMILDFIN